MAKKIYQENYASGRPQMYDTSSREKKAVRIIKTLEDYFKDKELKDLKVLDIGSSTGIIDNVLAKEFKSVVGVDIDKSAVKFAKENFKRKNLSFVCVEGLDIPFGDNSFDVIVCTHVYEHVPDAKKLFDEIFRTLKPSGVCYLAALNRLWPLEPHYNLLFLSWLPKSIANIYVKLLNKSDGYYETTLSYWGLKELTNKFSIVDYTPRILSNPTKFSYDDVLAAKGVKGAFLKIFSGVLKFFVPTFFWILVKR